MTDEFEEADVMFVHVEVSTKHDNFFKFEKHELSVLKRRRRRKRKTKISSVPIDIPENKSNLCKDLTLESDLFEEDDDTSEDQMTPPHVTRRGRKTPENVVAYSICTRPGETLKIRDFIFKITGFLET
ncbi:hypothetical protein R6Q59_008768 [Mikania micrantha]|uniref:Uncharacterized protein n=1 Tax=Mikania micrantha TaxID=192012 RepID=A0A5N6LJG2_9ASTR|nr:hypothetical protein E3N88_41862 [Mikania micrantha]